MRIVLPIVIAAALAIYALIDCGQADRAKVRPPGKPLWLLIILVPIVGPVAWLVLGRPAAAAGRPASAPRPRPLAPDDDPEFLRRIRPVTDPRPAPPRPEPEPEVDTGPDRRDDTPDPAPQRDEADHRNGPETDPGDGDTR